ncbi:hypothetical protein KCP70_11785 [Salmonella enterica subsp. enterica]|nr:hypothetical protein KCP70_11785 [Salmonella enterica subsp. enterica]
MLTITVNAEKSIIALLANYRNKWHEAPEISALHLLAQGFLLNIMVNAALQAAACATTTFSNDAVRSPRNAPPPSARRFPAIRRGTFYWPTIRHPVRFAIGIKLSWLRTSPQTAEMFICFACCISVAVRYRSHRPDNWRAHRFLLAPSSATAPWAMITSPNASRVLQRAATTDTD